MNPFELSPEFLETRRIPDLPTSFYYIPEFITPEEEETLLSKIYDPKSKWQNLSHRRLQVYPAALTPSNVLLLNSQSPANNTAKPNPLPPWLVQPIQPKLHALGLFQDAHQHQDASGKGRLSAPNHCLINEYQPGQGIMPHEDGAAYRPIVATVSLGSHTVLDLFDKPSGPDSPIERSAPRWRILQERRSLLVTVGHAYECCLHGIADVHVDRALGPSRHPQPQPQPQPHGSGQMPTRQDDRGSQTAGSLAGNGDGVGIANWNCLADTSPFESGECARATRVSLTFRDVLKVKDVSRALFGKPR